MEQNVNKAQKNKKYPPRNKRAPKRTKAYCFSVEASKPF
jgi:hypothetical protein